MNIKLANKMKNFRRTTMRKKENIESSSSRNLLYFCKSTVWNKNLSTLSMQESLTLSAQSAKMLLCFFFFGKETQFKTNVVRAHFEWICFDFRSFFSSIFSIYVRKLKCVTNCWHRNWVVRRWKCKMRAL